MVIIAIVVLVLVCLLALIIGLSVGLNWSWWALQRVSNRYHRGRGCEACWEAFPRCVLLLNKQAFPPCVWAVGSFADHPTPVLTCFSACSLSASTSVEENHYRWGLSLSSSSSSSSRLHSRRKVLLPSSMLPSSTPSSVRSLAVDVNLNPLTPLISLKEQTVHLTFGEKRKIKPTSSSWLLQCCKDEAELHTRHHAEHICVAAKKGNNQTISLLQTISVRHFKPSIQKVCIISCPDEPRHIV